MEWKGRCLGKREALRGTEPATPPLLRRAAQTGRSLQVRDRQSPAQWPGRARADRSELPEDEAPRGGCAVAVGRGQRAAGVRTRVEGSVEKRVSGSSSELF